MPDMCNAHFEGSFKRAIASASRTQGEDYATTRQRKVKSIKNELEVQSSQSLGGKLLIAWQNNTSHAVDAMQLHYVTTYVYTPLSHWHQQHQWGGG